MVVVDHGSGRLVWAKAGHDRAALRSFFEAVGEERCRKIRLVSCDAAEWVATAKARLVAFEADASEVTLGAMRVGEAARTTRAIDHRRGRLTSALEDAEAALAYRERSDAEAASMDPRRLAAQVSRG